eukprot:scaffold9_cov58-Attheya_sp.AAC.1
MAWTELHDLCASPDSTPQHFVRLRLHIAWHPHEASEEYDDGSLPLHYLLRNNPPLEIVQDLVEAYPEAVFMAETMKGYYPLHVACRYGCCTENTYCCVVVVDWMGGHVRTWSRHSPNVIPIANHY